MQPSGIDPLSFVDRIPRPPHRREHGIVPRPPAGAKGHIPDSIRSHRLKELLDEARLSLRSAQGQMKCAIAN